MRLSSPESIAMSLDFVFINVFLVVLLQVLRSPSHSLFSLLFFLIHLFLERGEGREKERERNINVWLPLSCPLSGAWPATQSCVLTGNQTGNPLVLRPGTQSIEPLQPGLFSLFSHSFCYSIFLFHSVFVYFHIFSYLSYLKSFVSFS